MPLAYSYLRFSSTDQAKGASIRRQVEMRDKWLAAKKNVRLDTSFVLPHDRGVSAFRGRNVRDGALGRFLKAIEEERIKPGSYLIVENLDRLSRDQVSNALSVFLEIINAGIVVVTLDGEPKEFRENPNEIDLIAVLLGFSRSHNESVRKSQFGRHNWAARRGRLEKEVFTARVPNWIDVLGEKGEKNEPDNRELVLNAEKAAVVRRIFKLCLGGMGSKQIADTLTVEQVPHISRQHGQRLDTTWCESSVYKILTSRACIGEFQPQQKVEQKVQKGSKKEVCVVRERLGSPVKDYYPAVVDETTFFRVQKDIKERSNRGTGRSQSVGSVNLFVGVVRDREGTLFNCRLRNGHRYLVSKAARKSSSKADLVLQGLAYDAFEEFMLDWLWELRLRPEDGVDEVDGLRAKLCDLTERIGTMKRKIREKNLESLFDDLAVLEGEQRATRSALEEAEAAPKADQLAETRDLIQQLRKGGDADSVRRQLRQQVRMLVKSVTVQHIVGKPRDPNKSIFLHIEFADGQHRLLWYRTNRAGLIGGEMRQDGDGWSPDDVAFLVEDLEELVEAA